MIACTHTNTPSRVKFKEHSNSFFVGADKQYVKPVHYQMSHQ